MYNMRFFLSLFVFFFAWTQLAYAQIISIDPPLFTLDEQITVIYDATQGSAGLVGVTPVYAHTGIITAAAGPGNWQNVQGVWGTDDSNVVMAPIGSNRHLIQFVPRDFYGIAQGEEVTQLAFVFRNRDGSREGKTTSLGDIFIDVPDLNAFTGKFITPDEEQLVLEEGNSISIRAAISMNADYVLFDNEQEIASGSGTEITFDYNALVPGNHVIRFEASNGVDTVEDSFSFVVLDNATSQAELPEPVDYGANVLADGSVLLRLFAPEKEHVFALTDLTNFRIDADFQMSQTPDGNDWWIQIGQDDTDTEFLYQYLIDGTIKIADPYSTLILDNFNDAAIEQALNSVPVDYPRGLTSGHISYVDLDPQDYPWQNNNFQAAAHEDLVIYELLLRDFLADHSFDSLTDTLTYLSKLGVNTIELMPVSEFENNDSWGYNPSYHMALDKYYGSPESFKRFVDTAHGLGMAVILDIVYNHAFGQSPLVRMYWDSANSRPAADSPYFNPTARHPFNVGFDFNHDTDATQTYTKQTIDYWLDEFRIDGFRFDLSKGFTQKFSTNDGVFAAFDIDRINRLTDYGNHIWQRFPGAILILEHFATNSEEVALADNGFLLWSNANFNSNEASMGWNANNGSNFSHVYFEDRGWPTPSLLGYMESHDEERLMYKNLTFGNSTGNYTTRDLDTGLRRNAMTAAFFFGIPGPKLMWQFGELGYDFSINTCVDGSVSENCRLARKPIRWDYTNQANRDELFRVYRDMFRLKASHPAIQSDADVNLSLSGATKSIISTSGNDHLVIVGNFDVVPQNVSIHLPATGTWYDYFLGTSFTNSSPNYTSTLAPGEFHVFINDASFTTSVEGLDVSNDEFNIYPNPAHTQVVFSTASKLSFDVIIYDVTGIARSRQQNVLNDQTIDLSNLESGIFFLQILQGINSVKTLRVIVE